MTLEAESPPVADRCLHSRAFSAEFRGCPAFTPTEFTPMDTMYTPLRPVLTCRHLASGGDQAGGYYPRCQLGDDLARQHWVDAVGRERLAEMRQLSLEYRAWVSELMPGVWEIKASVLAAAKARRDTTALEEQLQAAVAGLVAAAEAWVDAHGARLADAGLEPGALKQLVRVATAAWAEAPSAGVQSRVSEEILAQFPEPVQAFIRAGR